jgi:hypothetical protein
MKIQLETLRHSRDSNIKINIPEMYDEGMVHNKVQ